MTVNTAFEEGENGWVSGFSDYPVADESIYQLVSGIQQIPDTENKTGYLLGGMNRSDDLFMYLKKQISGLVPNTRYTLTVEVTFWSDAGNVCFGIGGSPGDAVYIKAGATELEPAQADYYMNIDTGHQSQDGNDARVLGNVSIDGLSCDSSEFGSKSLSLSSEMAFEIFSSSDGQLWVMVGSDSGYEGQTHLYYESINVTLTPS